jgi:hypothetical protein
VGTGTLTGTITTDINEGIISPSDVVSWSLTIASGAYTVTLTPSNSFFYDVGGLFTAQPDGLYFNFASSNGGNALSCQR